MHVGGTELASSRCNTLNSEINHCFQRHTLSSPPQGAKGTGGGGSGIAGHPVSIDAWGSPSWCGASKRGGPAAWAGAGGGPEGALPSDIRQTPLGKRTEPSGCHQKNHLWVSALGSDSWVWGPPVPGSSGPRVPSYSPAPPAQLVPAQLPEDPGPGPAPSPRLGPHARSLEHPHPHLSSVTTHTASTTESPNKELKTFPGPGFVPPSRVPGQEGVLVRVFHPPPREQGGRSPGVPPSWAALLPWAPVTVCDTICHLRGWPRA